MTARATFEALAWALLLAVLALKAWFGLWILTHCESAAPWHYLCADIAPWAEFLDRTASGAIPYVDFAREYPVGAGTLFWALGTAFGAHGFDGALRLQVALSFVSDLACALLLHRLLARNRLAALGATLLWLGLPTALLLSPLRFESTVALSVLGGYWLERRGHARAAVVVWALGASLKWYPALAIVAQQMALDRLEFRRSAPRAAALFVGVVAAVNAPFLLGDWLAHGHVDHWLSTYLFHAERRLAPDTVLGVLALWLGEIPFEQYASLASVAAAGLVLVTRRELGGAPKLALACMALLVLNRVYSPQFNLWFYPPLLLVLGAARPLELAAGAVLLIVLDLLNVSIFPFLYAGVVDELGGFDWGIAPWSGKRATELFTTCVLLRAFLLLALSAVVYRVATPQPQSATGNATGSD